MSSPKARPAVRHYFVDEAGDLTVLGPRGRVLVGQPGVSDHFMVGICELPDPAAAALALDSLRAEVLADPLLKGVQSLSAAARKTALAFHAKDDISEVRNRVFRLLPSLSPKMTVALRRKSALVAEARSGVPMSEGKIYSDTISKAGTNLLHRADEIRIVVAARGATTRNAALTAALGAARDRFNSKWGTNHEQPIHIRVGVPSDHAGLQVADYLLWALQRMIVRREDQYYSYLADHFSVIYDVDDCREKGYGRFYNRSRPLSLDTLLPLVAG